MSDTNDSSSSDFEGLDNRAVRKVYLITYSQVEVEKCKDRETFSQLVLKAFDPKGDSVVKPLHWAVCQEPHKKDSGIHYHMCMKLSGNKRWLGAKYYLQSKHKISVHFSDRHSNYISAYRYVTKTDKNVLLSVGHPELEEGLSPQTSSANKSLMAKRRRSRSLEVGSTSSKAKTNKSKRLSKVDVMDIVRNKNIKTETELLSLASVRAEEGLFDLKVFIANTPANTYNELISKTWKLAGATKLLEHNLQNRIDRLVEYGQSDCVDSCNGEKLWFKMATQVLHNNKINKYVFAKAVRDLLTRGRGKNRNLLVVGPANCGKTFLLNPLTKIYKCFSNPSSAKYAFVGVQDCELMFLNDLRWCSDMIPWSEFLNLLEGQTVHLATPKSHFAEDIVLSSDMPVFSTSISMIKFTGRSNNIEGENAMMEARWRKFELFATIHASEQKDVESCPRCFSDLVLLGADV